jgi:hydroxypyruvate reductase
MLERSLREEFELSVLPAAGEREAFLSSHGAGVRALVTSATIGADAELIGRLPALQVISSFGVGLDRLDLQTAQSRGIPVGYTPDLLSDCVADMAFGLMLDVARRISQGDRFVRAGRWVGVPGTPPPSMFPLGRQVSHARLGILGLGRIGRTLARRASGFEMDVRYTNRERVAEVPWTFEPDLLELARWCDFLVVCTSGGPGTRHLVDGAVLDALGKKGFLVNVSRGSLIDETALLRALQEQRIGGAALDVFDREPNVPPALIPLENVVLLPHLSSATEQTRQAMARRVVENLRSYFSHGTLVSAAPSA